MSIKRRLYDQFRLPRGLLGRLAGRIMSSRTTNQQRSEWTVEQLALKPGDRVLELGYGPGLGIAAVLDRLESGEVVGVDHSTTMRSMAARRLRTHPSAIVPDLRVGDVEALPDELGVFDKIFSCNVWLFWRDQVAVLERLRGHLTPGGTMAVTHLPRHGNATRDSALDAGRTIAAQLEEAGYDDIRQEVLELDPVPAVCVLATTPPSGAS
jgi:ubiquinone/menaquinone biosynthesis C-methylase UbiE